MEQVSSQLLALGYLQEPLSANSRSTALKQLEQAVHKLLAASKTDAQFRESLSSSQRELSFERGRLQDQLEKALRDLDHAQKEQKLAQNVKE